MGLLGIALGLGLLVWLSLRGWSVLLLARWTQTFMVAAGGFMAQAVFRSARARGEGYGDAAPGSAPTGHLGEPRLGAISLGHVAGV